MIENKLFNVEDINKKRNGLEAVLKGLETSRAEAIMWNHPHDKIDLAINKFKNKLKLLQELNKETLSLPTPDDNNIHMESPLDVVDN